MLAPARKVGSRSAPPLGSFSGSLLPPDKTRAPPATPALVNAPPAVIAAPAMKRRGERDSVPAPAPGLNPGVAPPLPPMMATALQPPRGRIPPPRMSPFRCPTSCPSIRRSGSPPGLPRLVPPRSSTSTRATPTSSPICRGFGETSSSSPSPGSRSAASPSRPPSRPVPTPSAPSPTARTSPSLPPAFKRAPCSPPSSTWPPQL